MNKQSHIKGDGALKGVRVIDITTTVLGPVATQILDDLGADVVKIEPPQGDPMRHLGPSRNEGMAAMFLGLNRNKRSIVLDLKKPESGAVLERLVANADVVVHNMRPNAADRLGISYAHLSARNPRLVYASASGYRRDGPNRDPRFAKMAQRTFHFEQAFQYLNEAMVERTTAEWIAAFNAVDLPNGPVNGLDDLFDSTYLRETGFFKEYDHPSEGRLLAANPSVSFSRTPSRVCRPPPRLGEHTREVMAEAGFLEQEISTVEAHQVPRLGKRGSETAHGELQSWDR